VAALHSTHAARVTRRQVRCCRCRALLTPKHGLMRCGGLWGCHREDAQRRPDPCTTHTAPGC
jgi:hypothetical protein